jgi:outer membrane protein assembly factor BamD
MRKNLLYSVILTLALVSCSGFEKILKSPDYKLKYRKAFEFYNKEEYVKAATLFDDIVNYFRGTTKADTITFYQAMSYYKQKDYILGGHYFGTFAQNFMYSPFTEEAEFLEAYCYYQLSPRPQLDQTSTTTAIESFRSFVNKYPLSKHSGEARELISEMQDKLVEKSRLNAKLYYDMGVYKASIIALKNSLDEFPDTKYKEELMWLVLDSNYQLAANSVPTKQKERFQSTIDEYYSFTSRYPNSKYKKDADKIYQEADNFLKANVLNY